MEIILLIAILLLIATTEASRIAARKSSRKSDDELLRAIGEIHSQTAQDIGILRAEQEARLDRLRDSLAQRFDAMRETQHNGIATLSADIQAAMANLARDTHGAIANLSRDTQLATTNATSNMQKAIAVQTKDMQEAQATQGKSMQENLHLFLRNMGESTEKIRLSVEDKLIQLQGSNERKLDEMRQVVNEKLEKTLKDRLDQSFANVSTHLENVYKGLGEMKTVAQSVGSLNRILSGTKSRGILGEVQLGQIVEDMLSPQQYDKEVPTFAGSTNRVEYAVKLPGLEDGSHVYLPIDSKFPLESYERLLDSYETGEPDAIDAAKRALQSRIRAFAKDVMTKYVSPPETTHFAVIFLPTEGLYAEVVRDAGFFDGLRQDGIIMTGPSTFSAMLNSLQMGFKTLQIQKGAADIEKRLSAAKREFGTFEDALTKAHKRITDVGTDIEKLVGTRTRAINRSLREIPDYSGDDSALLLGITEDQEPPE